MTWRLRAGVAADMAALLALDRATVELPHWTEEEYLRYVGVDAETQGRWLRVAEESATGRVVGFAAASYVREVGRAELESVVVAGDLRRQGMARALCAEAVAWWRERGAMEAGLEVRARSTGAIALYEQLGFRCVGRRRDYYARPVDDAQVMTLTLSGVA